MTDKTQKYLLLACRLITAALFIFSGISKAIDPWATSFVIEEYLRAYSMESMLSWSIPFAILLSGFELMLGLLLLSNILPRIISWITLIVISIFTIVTLLSATVFTIADCGCFGEVLKLSPWLTFAKNITLLPFVVYLFWAHRKAEWWSMSILQYCGTALYAVLSFGIGIYSYLYLPIIDLTDYKVGVNLYKMVVVPDNKVSLPNDTYIYKNLSTGELREFSLEELSEVSTKEWEWIETKEAVVAAESHGSTHNFVISDAQGDATEAILSRRGRVYLICITRFNAIPQSCAERLAKVVVQAEMNGDLAVVLTPDMLNGVTYYNFATSPLVRCYNIDDREMKNLLRAENGLVVLENGVIREKYNCRSIDF